MSNKVINGYDIASGRKALNTISKDKATDKVYDQAIMIVTWEWVQL